MFVDLVWLADFVGLVTELKEIYDALEALVDEPEEPEYASLTDAQRLQILKRCTLIVHKLRLDIACYPLTDSAVVFLDSVGDPIPLGCLED